MLDIANNTTNATTEGKDPHPNQMDHNAALVRVLFSHPHQGKEV